MTHVPDARPAATPLHPATASTESRDTTGYFSSGQSPGSAQTLHLIGAGKVGQQVLQGLLELGANAPRLVAASDRSGSVYRQAGLDLNDLLATKQRGGSFAALPQGQRISAELAVALTAADVVIDATSTDEHGTADAVQRVLAALRVGSRVVLCGKNALAERGAQWLTGPLRARLGIDAVLGGTGAEFSRELPELRAQCHSVAVVANATSTVILQELERGASFAAGEAIARERGLLEGDPSRDFDGRDAATKLLCVTGALFGETWQRALQSQEVPRQDLRELDVELLRARKRRGATTRLVARGSRAGRLSVAFEEVPVGSPLLVPGDRVVYCYELPGHLRVHQGLALGAQKTAAAALRESLRLLREAAALEVLS